MEQDKFVINIGRQLGSGGKAVGEALGRRLGVHVYDKQLINLAAEQSGLCTELFEQADEKKSRSLFSSLIGYLRMPFASEEGSVTDVLSSEALFKIQSDVIRDIASRESCIFVGRCADYILRDQPKVLRLFVYADHETCVKNVTELYGLVPKEAEERISSIDRTRSAYYKYYTGCDWTDVNNYDLCLNTGKIGFEKAVDAILAYMKTVGLLPAEL